MQQDKIPNEMTGLFHNYNDRALIDDEISDVDALLATLHLLESKDGKAGKAKDAVKSLFLSMGRRENNFNVALHRAKKQNFIEDKDGKLFFLAKGLKELWRFTGNKGKQKVYIIKEGQHFAAVKLFEEFMSEVMSGDQILLFDPHFAASSLFGFTSLKGKLKTFRIITANLYEPEKLKAYAQKFQKELNCIIEVKKSFKCHDRWLILNNSCWSIGSSLKDLGNKDTIINDISSVRESLTELFEERWKEAKPI